MFAVGGAVADGVVVVQVDTAGDPNKDQDVMALPVDRAFVVVVVATVSPGVGPLE